MEEYTADDIQPIIPPGQFCEAFLYSRLRGKRYGVEKEAWGDDVEDPLWLILPWEFELLANGQKLEHIDGYFVVKGRDEIDASMMLNSYMRYGIRESWFRE